MSNALSFCGFSNRTVLGDTQQELSSPSLGQRIADNAHMAKNDEQLIREGFTSRLKEAMEDAGIIGSVRYCADKLEIPKSSFEHLIGGTQLPGRARGLYLAARLSVREEWLIEGIPPKRHSMTKGALPIDHMKLEDQRVLLATWESIQQKYGALPKQ